MAAANLVYFKSRGYAELIRLVMAATGVKFTDQYVETKQDLEDLRNSGKLLFNQIPLLELDGLQIVQVRAILHYLARKGGIMGSNNEETTRIEMLFEGARDFFDPIVWAPCRDEAAALEQIKEKTLPRYLPIFNEQLKKNGTGFLVGNSLTLADLQLFEPLLLTQEYYGENVLQEYPELERFVKKISSMEKIAAFLNGPQRKPRTTHDLFDKAKDILGIKDWPK